METINHIITLLETNKLPISIAFAWFCREYPTIAKLGGIWGIVKTLIIGLSNPNTLSEPVKPAKDAVMTSQTPS